MNEILFYSLTGFIIFNIYITLRVVFSSQLDVFQKTAQSLIIWLLPVIGGTTVLYLLNDIDRNPPQGPTDVNNNQHF
ncbi:hypothetical protein MNBD_GAMMA10-2485 [hydrothermal vent metagenome]|uniref:Uncharacterized protein n=1 Tax=hydrothermal vent metagenome TaxID=652676 RepID=A0A3B0XJC3_9ZZZZ